MPYHLLIAEDSRMQRAILKETLQDLGYRVTAVKDGEQALEELDRERPDLVLSDVDMPKLGGYDLCRQVKKRHPDLPVALLTTLRNSDDIIRGIQAGADNYLTKPYEKSYLSSRLRSLLQGPEDSPESDALQVKLGGELQDVTAGRRQILNLLLSTFENAVEQNRILRETNEQLTEAQARLEEQNQTLSALNEQKNELLGMAAHDLRNPLNVVQGYSTFLLEFFENEPKREKFLQSILKSTKRMLNLVTDLLDVSAIESGRVQLFLEKTDVRALAEECVEVNQPLADKKQIDLVLRSEPDIPLQTLDSAKVNQVLTNLITNAVKYSHPKTRVEVRLKKSGGGVLFEVSDEGQGIPPGEQVKLFQPFSKTSVKTTAGETSTGLGLAIVKKIVEGHGGEIWVESQVGEGSTFRCYFPENRATKDTSEGATRPSGRT